MKNIRLPKLKNNIAEIIRVNYAGEYGAKRIYIGQLSVLGNSDYAPEIEHMAEQEEEHLEYFKEKMLERKVRPSLLHPLWHSGGYFLGKITALMGINMAMICTEAVEEVIDNHYLEQINVLHRDENALQSKIIKFREDEIEHKKTASSFNQNKDVFSMYSISIIKFFCKISIELAKKI